MRISIEWFLLDNTVMNYLVFALSAALCGARIRLWRILVYSLFGAVYALLSLSALPILQSFWCKCILFALFALPLFRSGRGYLLSVLCVFVSAFLIGGLLLFMTLLLGGTVAKNGTLMGTVPLRAALAGIALCAVLPRFFRKLIRMRRIKECMVPLKIVAKESQWLMTGFVDSGNLVVEPVSGLPVIFVNCKVKGNIPIPFSSAGGEGITYAARPVSVSILMGRWYKVDALIATAPSPIAHGEAIVPQVMLSEEWRANNVQKVVKLDLFKAVFKKGKDTLVHTFRRNTTAAVGGTRGNGLHTKEQD